MSAGTIASNRITPFATNSAICRVVNRWSTCPRSSVPIRPFVSEIPRSRELLAYPRTQEVHENGGGDRDSGLLGADLEILERDVAVDGRLPRQPEHAVADDVALDLVGAAGDAGLERVEHHLHAVAARLVRRVPRHRTGAGELEHHRPHLPGDDRAEQLAERATGTGGLARLLLVAVLHRHERLGGLHRPD